LRLAIAPCCLLWAAAARNQRTARARVSSTPSRRTPAGACGAIPAALAISAWFTDHHDTPCSLATSAAERVEALTRVLQVLPQPQRQPPARADLHTGLRERLPPVGPIPARPPPLVPSQPQTLPAVPQVLHPPLLARVHRPRGGAAGAVLHAQGGRRPAAGRGRVAQHRPRGCSVAANCLDRGLPVGRHRAGSPAVRFR